MSPSKTSEARRAHYRKKMQDPEYRIQRAKKSRAWARAHPQKAYAQTKKWVAANRAHSRQINRAWYYLNHHKLNARRRDLKYGLVEGQWDRLFAAQQSACAICKSTTPKGRNWHVDHDHVTGSVRGILCGKCNVALGMIEDSAQTAVAMATYLTITY